MNQSAATVIDLDAYRRRRQPGAATATPTHARTPVFWVYWVPVWLWA